MLLLNNEEYYPLEFGKMVYNNEVYYDRSERKKSWFYLDLSLESTPDSARIRDPTFAMSNP